MDATGIRKRCSSCAKLVQFCVCEDMDLHQVLRETAANFDNWPYCNESSVGQQNAEALSRRILNTIF